MNANICLYRTNGLVAAGGKYKKFHQHSVLFLHAQAQILLLSSSQKLLMYHTKIMTLADSN